MLRTWIKRSFLVGMGFGLLAPVISHAYGEASIIQNYVARQTLVPLIKPSWGNFILHSETLNKLYSLRGYEAIWVDSNGAPTAMAQTLRGILLRADRHGLNATDYWDGNVENLYKATLTNPKNWITFELAATEAMIRYVTHMSVGRFDPEQIDDDIKFKAKAFNEFAELNAAISYGPQSMGPALDNFAPNYQYHYAGLMRMLAKFKAVKANGGWAQIPQSKVDLTTDVKNPLVLTLRARLNELGYDGGNLSSDVYDGALEKVVKEFQEYNGLFADGKVSAGGSGVINALNKSPDYRIQQIIVNMEKLRWLPRNVEARHIFVNLAMTQVKVFDGGDVPVLDFNSVNGQPFRRTPSMRDTITYVNLNPYWTAPRSIVVKDKIPVLRREGYSYLEKHGMELYTEADETTPLSDWQAASIQWSSITAKNFDYILKQKPGINNALGVVKFPLQNPWAIYLHDTNEPNLFREQDQNRHRSSGCVRLEQALDLAIFLIKGQPINFKNKIGYRVSRVWVKDDTRYDGGYYTDVWDEKSLLSFVARDSRGAPRENWDISVTLKEPMPVYMMYLSATSSGTKFRFVEDPYGQDQRIMQAIKNYRAKGELF